jgi:uridine phosphorylase
VVPSYAVRDEGTSYHYAPPAREIGADPAVVAVIEDVLRESGAPYRVGKTWTTDAIYRETRGRIARRAAEGCITVEMECAAFIAVARFRGVRFGQILAISDDVSGEVWGPRHADHEETMAERLFWWSVEACVRL